MMRIKKIYNNAIAYLFLICAVFPSAISADDTEIYFSQELTSVNPNVLFILDVSGSMSEIVEGSGDADESSDVDDDLFRHWLLNETSGNTAIDSSGNNHNGALKNGPSWENDALRFDGNNDYVDLGGLDVSGNKLSLTAWAKADDLHNCSSWDCRIISKAEGTKEENHYWMLSTVKKSGKTRLRFRLKTGSTTTTLIASSGDLVDGEWFHAAAVYDGSTMKLYKNGVEVGSTSKSGNIKTKASIEAWIGGNPNNEKSRPWDGLISDVRIYQDALTEEEVNTIKDRRAVDKTRIELMRSALRKVLENAPTKLNVGLMNYGAAGEGWRNDYPNGVKFPVKDIGALAKPIVQDSLPISEWDETEWWRSNIPQPDDAITVRDYLSVIANGWDPEGYTPIVGALYEAALYFRGEEVKWGYGEAGNGSHWAAHPATYDGAAIENDTTICNSTGIIRYRPSKIDAWLADNTWATCPANRDSPQSPGSHNNCKATEHDCYTYKPCKTRAPKTCPDNEYDENGSCINPQGGECIERKSSSYWEEYCRYSICDGGLAARPNYTSPILQECQSNFIVLLSDGKPEYSPGYDGNGDGTESPGRTFWKLANNDWTGGLASDFDTSTCAESPSSFPSGRCGPELTSYLSDHDNSSLQGDQTIDTYVIGFGLGAEADAQDYLKSLVTKDDLNTEDVTEGYFAAGDEEQLVGAFSSILQSIGATTTAFASPGYSISVKSGLSHDDSVYIPVFDKKVLPLWSGNLKKFKINPGIIGTGEEQRSVRKIQGKSTLNGVADTDAATELGAFTDAAWDLWSESATADGREVTGGGVASKLVSNSRNLYSDLTCESGTTCDLATEANEISVENVGVGNNDITRTLLDVTSDNANWHKQLICFIRGRTGFSADTTPPACSGDERKHMGDMLHAEPIVVTYDKDFEDATNRQVIFAGTNEGYLHAFDTNTGNELFAFMPKELMKNIKIQRLNSEVGGHRYGIDGFITTWIKDIDDDGVIESADGDHVYLYFGLRRGGKSYYALDVTDPESPQLLWKIEGGSGNYAKLGQSWSIPYLTKIHTSSTDATLKEVVIFTGGYDTNQDDGFGDRNTTDSKGDDIYIVDATTGAFIWSMKNGSGISGSDALEHSLPGGVRILDINRDGAVDRMYFADVAGNVWRLELDGDLSDDDESMFDLGDSKLIKLAALGGTDSSVDKRKFYNEPDVSIFNEGAVKRLMISIGSGYRSHPVEEGIDDRFYALLDEHYLTALPDNYSPIVENDLAAISMITTTNDEGVESISLSNALDNQTVVQAEKKGWLFNLPKEREKVLANSVTSHGIVLFTTLVPNVYSSGSSASDVCGGGVTQGRLYAMNVLTGKPASDLNNSGGDPDTNDIYTVISANEIPGSVQLIFNEPVASDADGCVEGNCVQNVDVRSGKKLSQVMSYNAGVLESVFWSKPQEKQE